MSENNGIKEDTKGSSVPVAIFLCPVSCAHSVKYRYVYCIQREATTISFITGNVPFRDSSSFKILIVVIVHSGSLGSYRPLARMALVV